MRFIASASKTAGVLLTALLFLATMPATAQDVEDIIASVSEKVELTQDQENTIRDMDLTALHEHAALWYVSARLQQLLTDDQKSMLMSDGRRGAPVMRQSSHFRPRAQRHVRRGWRGQDTLSEEQREVLREEMEEVSEQHRELREQLRTDEIDRETYREEMRAMREQMHAELEETLTDEQREKLRAHRESMQERRLEYRERRGDREERAERPRLRGSSWSGDDAREQREVLAIYRILRGEVENTAHHRNNR